MASEGTPAQLELSFDEATPDRILVGSSLEVHVIIRNVGTRATEIGDWVQLSPLRYELRSADDPAVVHQISEAAYLAPRDIPVFTDDREFTTLNVHEHLVINESLQSYSLQSFAPGNYHLLAIYDDNGEFFVSPAHELRIQALSQSTMSGAICHATGNFAAVVGGTDELLQSAILQWNDLGEAPCDGFFIERSRRAERIEQVSQAVQLSYQDEGRWVAWLEGAEFHALQGWGGSLQTLSDPCLLPSPETLLHPRGIQADASLCHFFAVDSRAGKLYHLRCDEERTSRTAYDFPCRLLEISQYVPGDSERLALFSGSTVGAETTIAIEAINIEGASVLEQRRVLDRKSLPLAACAASAVLDEGNSPRLHLLWGPAEEDRVMVYQVILCEKDGASVDEWIVIPPTGAVDHWGISTSSGPMLPVVAQVGQRLLYLDAVEGGIWREAAQSYAGHAFSLDVDPEGKHWLSWLDKHGALCADLLIHRAAPLV